MYKVFFLFKQHYNDPLMNLLFLNCVAKRAGRMEVTKTAFETARFFTWSMQLIRNEKSEYCDFSNKSGTAFFVIWIMTKTV